jgi:alanine racemase
MLTWLEINSRAIEYNLRQFKKLLGKNTLLMPVIKSNAYGHGFFNIAQICNKSPDVDRICVVSLAEALALTDQKLNKKPIFILSFFDKEIEKIKKAASKNIIFPLYTLTDAKLLNRVGERLKKKITVHIKIDTGTSRLGVLAEEAAQFITQVNKMKWLRIEGLWSHFASSEEDLIFTKKQNGQLNFVYEELMKQGITIPLTHIACSAAITTGNLFHHNAVRLGISLYGLYPNLNKKILSLKPVLSWYTTVIQVKTVPSGTKIGYGGTFTTKKSTRIAILPIGYFDGYDRKLSNRGHVLIRGKICPIRGRICMNLCMVEVNKHVVVKAGDRVTLIGTEKTQTISADDMANWCQTINYEVVSRINPLLPRIKN